MFIARNTSRHKSGKVYHSVLLRESYREGKKVKKRTIANLSQYSEEEINAIDIALKNKKTIAQSFNPFELIQGRSIGSVYVLHTIAKELGIVDALGSSFLGKLTLWLIFARVLEQGSRLSATRLNALYDLSSIIELKRGFDENNLYDSLHWLSDNQNEIENNLFNRVKKPTDFYWYDVTSSYFEGVHNKFAAFGYNRDKKAKKRIVVVGLLCGDKGNPISIEAFKGNTQDTETFKNQLIKLKNRFECKSITMVCDRGLIKDKQKKLIKEYGYHYITALPMPQVLALLKKDIIKIENFTTDLKDLNHEGIRYIYRKNPVRAAASKNQREERFCAVQKKVDKENLYLLEHPKALANLAETRIIKKVKSYCVAEWVTVEREDRRISITIDEKKLEKVAEMDGCYIWTTDLLESEVSTKEIYERYKDLKYIEDDFRTFKTNHLEVRPIFVRSEKSTRGHLLVTMLSHMILRRLREKWEHLNKTVKEGLSELSTLCRVTIQFSNGQKVESIPNPNEEIQGLLDALSIVAPKFVEEVQVPVVTRQKTRKAANH